jgi:MoxR-like ATPase
MAEIEPFSDPRPFTEAEVASAPTGPGVMAVWGPEPDDGIVYVGQTSGLQRRLRDHLRDRRQATILTRHVGDMLDGDDPRSATGDLVQAWLQRCRVAWRQTDTPVETKAAMLAEIGYQPRFNKVGGTTVTSRVWWFNQNDTFEEEMSRWLVFSSKQDYRGRALVHNEPLTEMKPGDVTIHYDGQAVRAIGLVAARAVQARRVWGEDGVENVGDAVRIEYFPLDIPILFDGLPAGRESVGPFDSSGQMQQGYCFEVPDEWAQSLRDDLSELWPPGSPWAEGERRYWSFQANPDYYDLVAEMQSDPPHRWTVTKHRNDMQPGDAVGLWASGQAAGFYALARLTGTPAEDGDDVMVPLSITQHVTPPLLKAQVQSDPRLAGARVVKIPGGGTNQLLTPEEWQAVVASLPLGLTVGGRWDRFVHWARRMDESYDLATDERSYKLDIADELAGARNRILQGDEAWFEGLRAAVYPNANNLVDFRTKDAFLGWCTDEPDAARSALEAIWDDAISSGEAIERFSGYLPNRRVSGPGVRANLASMLRLAVDTTGSPVVRTTPFARAYSLVDFPVTKPESERTRYEDAVAFCDRFIAEAAERDVTIADRLDAQGLVWAAMTYHPHHSWSAEELGAFLSFRSDQVAGTDDADDDGVDRVEKLAAAMNYPRKFVEKVLRLAAHKGQLVFYGPPGTGKTHFARALAEHLAAGGGAVETVQFHPSYSYEDFVEGYRPRSDAGQLVYEVVDGPLKRIAMEARAAPDATHVLLVDEINRAVVSKVLGELYFLLEYRNQSLRLLYSEERFELPGNLVLLGTMNTADRSIALVDAALRRRFHFVGLYPDQDPVKGLLHRFLRDNGLLTQLSWLPAVVDRANELLGDRHLALGPSHFLRLGLDEQEVELIWEHSVLPYVEEHFLDQPDALARFELATLRQSLEAPS